MEEDTSGCKRMEESGRVDGGQGDKRKFKEKVLR